MKTLHEQLIDQQIEIAELKAEIEEIKTKTMKQLTDSMILEALETMAAAMPWDSVDIWVTREPEGTCRFTAFINQNSKLGAESVCARGRTPMEAAEYAIKKAGERDPEIRRQAKIRELKEQIAKLEQVVIGLPPYRPGTYLADQKTDVVEVETA